jgi:membrane-bound lytic murein transglycosylase D
LLLGAVAVLAACGGPSSSSTIGRSAVSVARESRAESGRTYTLGPQFEGQLHDLLGREAEALGGSREGVPLELNRQVLLNINRFLNEDRGFITRGLSRGSRYIPLMKNIFRQKGLPEDLVYLALIESGFNNSAVSRAAAVGPWQFITATGRRYGLTIDDWVDERRDPVKSTYAAADYLTDLHDTFGSWPLALAGYNSGEGKIIKGMKNYGVSNFWDMSSVGDHLANETKLYVPSFLAATFIAKDPAAYGLTIEARPPDQWDEVGLPQPVTLAHAAQYARTTVEVLKELNPHLKKESTPPQADGFILRLPVGSRPDFIAAYGRAGQGQAQAAVSPPPVPQAGASNLTRMRPELEAAAAAASPAPLETPLPRTAAESRPPAPRIHTVTSGDTLNGLAKKYKSTVKELTDLNQLKSTRLTVGQRLKVGAGAGSPTPAAPTAAATPRPAPAAPRVSAAPTPMVHTVAAGDTLGGLALKYGLKVQYLMDLNGLTSTGIRTGQKLKVAGELPATVTAAAGDTLYNLAQRHHLSVKRLKELNNLAGDILRPGQVLKIR